MPSIWTVSLDLRIQRIPTTVLGFPLFPDNYESDFLLGVIQEGVADTCARRECDAVTRHQRVEFPVDPSIRSSLHDKDELFLGALGVRIRGTPAGRKSNVMYANACQAKSAAE
ncbi:hypothetical protein ABID41_003169 [Phenylobacterium koreense]|uniref:Uncharacterized protein n=1 Tax=Phenylobacterium koreense TaxID=266125 RepID=A0ABV2EN63_9CAUL